jgi:hypothetical protein
MNYEQKYKKYKQKYFELKNNLFGGDTELDKLDFSYDSNLLDSYIMIKIGSNIINTDPMNYLFKLMFKQKSIDIKKLIGELEKDIPQDKKFILLVNKLFSKLFDRNISPLVYINEFIDDDLKSILTLILNKSKYRDCTVDDFMKFDKDRIEFCPNKKLVRGSCSVPGFFDKSSIDEYADINMKKLFETVKTYMVDKSELKIVVGATEDLEMKESVSNGLILYITPIISFIDINDAIKKLNNRTIINNSLKINTEFPLGTSKPLTIEILDIIINIKKSGKIVRLINKMCGSCFRSFYYLKNNGIIYEVNPDQGLTNDDTPQIRRCF